MKSFRVLAAFVILASIISHSAHAHPADQSEMRVRPKMQQLEIRLTFNLLTLTQFTGIDEDGDAKISMAELAAAQPRIATYLNQHIHVEINQQKALLGSGVRFEMLWPDAAHTPPMAEPEYAARKVDVTFVQTITGKVLEDFWLSFDIFEQTGPMQTVHALYEQDGRTEDVTFTAQEPEYLYDTGYADDPFVQDAAKKKAAPSAPPFTNAPLPSPTAAEPPYAVPTARLAPALDGSPAAFTNAATGNSAVTLASSIDPTDTPTDSLHEHWWMILTAMILVIIVIGRKLQLSARARRASTRRRSRRR
ncbi:hypothetical protein [Prosthecobacter sp.]|uniref:hypothetical protein n=1 Tax=Prosthecobacter sp. TaxID=1965333 RepID=UPI002487658E|nr:hypothetical protein [Prosthecobacter sp.]MDI1312905.1 hypothetical protein [Prosthecobacter sp.]